MAGLRNKKQQGSANTPRRPQSPLTDPERKIRMPDPNDPSLTEAQRQEIARRARMGGRLSTILSDVVMDRFRGR